MEERGHNDFYGTPGILIKSAEEVLAEQIEESSEKFDNRKGKLEKEEIIEYDQLTSHIIRKFQQHQDARRESGVEDDIIASMYQVSGKYTPEELKDIDGSDIYMNITATKQRAASSWIKDIVLNPTTDPFEIVTSKKEKLPEEIMEVIRDALEEDEKRLSKVIQEHYDEMLRNLSNGAGGPPQGQAGPAQARPQGPPQSAPGGQPQPPGGQPRGPQQGPQQAPKEDVPKSALIAAKKMKEISKLKRDVEEVILNEVHKVANHEVRQLNKTVSDSLQFSGFRKVLGDFIEDFTTFPTAFMKGPITTFKPKLVWKEGIAQQVDEIVFVDKRISPVDAYPAPGASDIYDGDFIEYLRLSPKEVNDMVRLAKKEEEDAEEFESEFGEMDGFDDAEEDTEYRPSGYYYENLKKLLDEVKPGTPVWANTNIESEKSFLESRGNDTQAQTDLYHGVHFWGSVQVKDLIDFGVPENKIGYHEDWEYVEVEVVVIDRYIVKCRINSDPLLRRPYYASSFHPKVGSIWGQSLPYLMRDIQGMCNAAARALADNMGMASGPQMSLLVDRLADDGDIEEQSPLKIWQFNSDPAGNGGRPVEWFAVPSNARELLEVYNQFEVRADDVTGVPRYAYGNERTGGATQTAQGLSMLLESASKGIKAAIMQMATGCIIPRVEYESYLQILKERENGGDRFRFNGDLNVVVKAVENITLQAARQQLRKELLSATSNPRDIRIMGYEGRGMLLREIFADVGLPEDAIPDRLELKEIQEKDDAREAASAEAQAQAGNKSVEATKIQADAQVSMHQGTLELQREKLDLTSQIEALKDENNKLRISAQERQRALDNLTRLEQTDKNNSAKIAVAVSKATGGSYEGKAQTGPTEGAEETM